MASSVARVKGAGDMQGSPCELDTRVRGLGFPDWSRIFKSPKEPAWRSNQHEVMQYANESFNVHNDKANCSGCLSNCTTIG